MLPPRKVKLKEEKLREENLKFRTFLKCNADEKELDEQFLELHNELFADYDCSRCLNCCKKYHGSIPIEDLKKDAEYLHLTKEDFIETFLQKKADEEGYITKHMPCDFLMEDGTCRLGNCKPKACQNFPHTNQPDRLHSLYSVLDVIKVCPVAFEIFERLKVLYNYKNRDL